MRRENISSLNLDKSLSNLIEALEKFNNDKPLAIALQDVPTISKESMEKLLNIKAPRYSINSKWTDNRDTAILTDTSRVDTNKEHYITSNSTKNRTSATGVSITRKKINTGIHEKSERILLISVYIRPRATNAQLEKLMTWINNTTRGNEGKSRTIIMGDFNAHNPLWTPIKEIRDNNQTSDTHYNALRETRGRAIAKTMKIMKINCLNISSKGPTYKRTENKGSYIDLAFAGSKVIRNWNQFNLENLNQETGHKIVKITSKTHLTMKKIHQHKEQRIIKSELINENHFIETEIRATPLKTNWKCLTRDSIIYRMNKLTQLLYEAIQQAQEKVTIIKTKSQCRTTQRKLKFNNTRTRRRITRLRKLEIRRNNLRNRTNRKEPRTTQTKQKRRKLNTKIKKIRTKLINDIDSNNLNTNQEMNVWDKEKISAKEMEIRTQNTTNIETIKEQKDIEKLAEQKFPETNRESKLYTEEAVRNKEVYAIQLEVAEIDDAIDQIRKKRYTSPEGIKMQSFYNAIKYTKDIVSTITEMSFATAQTPTLGQLTQGTLIPKKAPGQFRIVHVSSPISALIETIALKRLEYRLEANKLNSPYQYGFSTLRSRHDLMARIIELGMKHRINNKSKARTTIVSLDIEGAFDNVDQDELIHKMDKEFGKDPLKYWLANFIINRKIMVRIGNLKSQVRPVTKGVPQGSALGPILWNFMIRDIEKNITKSGKLELLKYADDIMIAYNGFGKPEDTKTLQNALNELTTRLSQLKLNIRPEKCSAMIINVRNAKNAGQEKIEIYIQDSPIKNTQTMNILGIPINNCLKLDTKSEEHEQKINIAIKKLHNIARLDLIHSSKEWSILIDSLLLSRLVINNWPILAIDNNGSKHIDNTLIKAARIIFDWPKNTSTGLIKLLLRYPEANTMARKMIKEKTTSEFRTTYEFIHEVNKIGRNIILKRNATKEPSNLETTTLCKRKHPDPSKRITVIEIPDVQEAMRMIGPMWTILEGKRTSMLTEVYLDNILQSQLGKHYSYPIPYFNSFSLINNMVKQTDILNRSLLIHSANSILMALMNINNHDWRVIHLREEMHRNGWRIYVINDQDKNRLQQQMTEHLKKLAPKDKPNPNNFEGWLAIMEENNNENQHEATNSTRTETKINSLKEPYLADYKYLNQLNRQTRMERDYIFKTTMTGLCRTLCSDPIVWQQITPNWIGGSSMLMLGGLTTSKQGELKKGESTNNQQCEMCEGKSKEESSSTLEIKDKIGLEEDAINRHTTLHRAIKCPYYETIRKKYLRKIKKHKNNCRGILMNRQEGQTLIKLLTDCAMNRS